MNAGMLTRAGVGGALMGLANLVPGISGGTMLVALGIYTQFIDAVSDLTRFRLTRRSIVLVGVVVLFAGLAIAGLSGLISRMLIDHRWAMYSLFIGLTWGGAPLLWRMIRTERGQPIARSAMFGIAAGVIVMAGLALLQMRSAAGSHGEPGVVMLLLGGIAGASAMILPGISGAYLMLLLGLYDTIIDAIKTSVESAKAGDVSGIVDQLHTIVPVGLGVVLGIAVVTNVLRFVLHRYERATLGVLLGLLIAAPAGLYPFREGVKPVPGDIIKGQVITAETVDEVKPKDWTQRLFRPTLTQIGGSCGLVIVGFGLTLAIDRLGRRSNTQAD